MEQTLKELRKTINDSKREHQQWTEQLEELSNDKRQLKLLIQNHESELELINSNLTNCRLRTARAQEKSNN